MSNRQMEDKQEEDSRRHMADLLGITYDEVCELEYNIEPNTSKDGMV